MKIKNPNGFLFYCEISARDNICHVRKRKRGHHLLLLVETFETFSEAHTIAVAHNYGKKSITKEE